MEGEPLTESGTRIAQEHCFPEDIIRIVSSANMTAKQHRLHPSSPRSYSKWPGQKR